MDAASGFASLLPALGLSVLLSTLPSPAAAAPPAEAGKLTLRSKDVKPDGRLAEEQVFSGFGCTGANLSPELSWENAPRGTKSFAVTLLDPDAPKKGGFWHWTVYDIPAAAKGLPKGAGSGKAPLPGGAKQGVNDFGPQGYSGPCPPPGDEPHRYVFTLYALGVDKLAPASGASAAEIDGMARSKALGIASFTARYARKK